MRPLAIVLLVAATAHADPHPCDVPELTCSDAAHRVECRVPGSADIHRMILYVRVAGGPMEGRLMERTEACTFTRVAAEVGDEFYVSARDATGAIRVQSAPRRFGAAEPLVVEHLTYRVETRSRDGRVMLELVAGGVAGVASGALAIAIGAHYSTPGHDEGPSERLIFGSYAAAVAGMSLAVWAVGSIGDDHGSLAATVAGAAVGSVTAIGITEAATNPGVIALFVLPIAGAIVGFNLTRDTDAPPIGSVVSFTGGRARLGVPLAIATREGAMMSLLSGRF